MMFFFGGGGGTGLEVGQRSLRAASVKKAGSGGRLYWAAEVGLAPGLLLNSFMEPNIKDVPAFVDALSRLFQSSGKSGRHVSVSLPDYISRVSILEFDALQGKREETEQMIRWRLKKLLPFDVELAAVRYQYLGKFSGREKDQHRFLVSIVKSEILEQYEAAFKEAGLRTRRIGISSFSTWNLFNDNVLGEAGEAGSFALMNLSGGKLTVMVFDRGVPHFLRLKDLGSPEGDDGPGVDVNRVLKELSASVTFYKENYSETQVERVYVTGDSEAVKEVVEEAGRSTTMKASLLDPEKVVDKGSALPQGASFFAYCAACGAATEA